jgi:tetratricopeptide (TPR) repeat protein
MLSEKGAADVLPSVELLIAYHKVAKRTHRSFAPSDFSNYFSERPTERRVFAFSVRGADFGFEGAISGRLDIEPFFIGPALHVRLKPIVAEYYKSGSLIDFGGAEAERHHKYASEPRTLIAGVRLRRGDIEIETEESADDRNGQVFVASLETRDVSDLWLDVDVAYFDKRYELTYPLYFGPFARAERIERGKVSAAEQIAAAAPDDPNALVALARAQREYGEPEAAWSSFAAALERDPALFDLWFEAADMFAAAGMPQRAVAVLERALQASPGDPDLTFALGAHAYDAGDYPLAARAFGALTAASPGDSEARTWEANALFLQGEWAAAADAFAALSDELQSPWIAMRRLIATAEAGGKPVNDFSAFDTTRAAMGEIEKRPCDNDFYEGFRARLSDQEELAAAAFARARASCAYGSFERRTIAELTE